MISNPKHLPKYANDPIENDENLDEELPTKISKKPKANPFAVYFLFFSTIFFCLSFWIYRQAEPLFSSKQNIFSISNFSSVLQSISPTFLLSKIFHHQNLNNAQLDSQIQAILRSDSRSWSIYAEVFDNQSPGLNRFWSFQPDGLGLFQSAQLRTDLQKLSPSNANSLSVSLPQGTIVRQNYQESGQTVLLSALLSVPNKDVLINIAAKNQIDLDKTKSLFPSLISSLYWSFAGN